MNFISTILYCTLFITTCCVKRHHSEMIPLIFIKGHKIELNLQAIHVGVFKEMKLDNHGNLYKVLPDTIDDKTSFVDVLPILFAKDGKLNLNIGAFHTGLYGNVDLTNASTIIS